MTAIEPAVNPLELLRLRGGQGKLDTERGGPARIDVVSREGMFKHSITGREVESFKGAIVNWTTQRTMWVNPMPMGEKVPPICRSRDSIYGMPSPELFVKSPVGITDENGAQITPLKGSGLSVTAKSIDAETRLDCSSCKLKDWGQRDPETKKSRKPFCGESYVVYVVADFLGNGSLAPALLTVHGAGMGPANKYFLGFEHAAEWSFGVWTEFSLNLVRVSSSVQYSVPVFERGESTEGEDWNQWATDALRTQDWLTSTRSDPSTAEDDSDLPTVAKVDLPEDF